MKKLRLLLSFFLLCVGANVAWSDDYTVVNQIRYRLNNSDHTAAIVQSQAANADNYFWRADGNFVGWSNEMVIIPESITYGGSNYSVTRLEEFNFSRCVVTMFLPRTVRYIGRIHCEKPIICNGIPYLNGYKGQINLFITGDWPDINLGECNASDRSSLDGSSNFTLYLCSYDYNSFTLNPNTHSGTTPCGNEYRSVRIYPWVHSAEGTGSSSHALPHYAQRGSDFKYFNHIVINNSAGGSVVSDSKTWPLSVFSIGSNGGSASIEYNEEWWEPFKIFPNPGNYPIVELSGQRVKDVYLYGSDDSYRVETPPSVNNSIYEISYVPEQTNVTVTSNGGKAVKVRTFTSNGSEICNTISAEGGSKTQTYNFSSSKDNQIELEINYDPSDYDLNLTYSDSGSNSVNWNLTNKNDGTKVYGIEYAKGKNVQIGVEFIPKSKLRKFNFVNFGEGSVHFYGTANGSATHYGYRGYWSSSPSFDYASPIRVVVTPPEGLEVKTINANPYILKSSWDVDETTGVVTVNNWFLMKDATNRLEVTYGPKVIDPGTQFNVHLSVEGSQGSCYINIGDGDNGWKDYTIEDNDIPYSEMVSGEMFDVIGAHDDDQYVEFWAVYDFGEYEEEGITNSVNVYANGELIDAEETDPDWGDHYLIPLDGCDMDIRVVFESNGRQLTGNNGNGGTLAIYKEGSSTAVATYPSGRFIWKTLPKTETFYAVITPNTGKVITALLRNGSLLPSPSSFLQSDGTYRIPLEDFGNGDTTYQLSITYGDEPYYTFNLSVVGDGSLKCIPFREENGSIQAIREVTASEVEGRNRIAKAYYNEIGETGYVEFYASVPKEGETLKVYLDGVDVSDKFTFIESTNNLRGVISSNPTEEQLGALNSVSVLAIYEEDAKVVDWKASMIGDIDSNEYVDLMVDGGDVEIELYPNTPTGTESFSLSNIGTNLGLYIYAEPDKSVQLLFNGEDYTSLLEAEIEGERMVYKIEGDTLTQFFVDGDWVISYAKTDDIIEFADANVKAICVANWDTNHDGELSKAEAAAVTTIRDGGSSVFRDNTDITSFDEFQYFTGLTSVDLNAFRGCTSLVSIKLPTTIKGIQNYGFFNCSSLSSIILPESLTFLSFAAFSGCSSLGYIYIPKNVSSITGGAFMGCNSMISIAVDPANTYFDSRGGCNAIIKKEGNILMTGCKNTIIPNDIESIQDRAFASLMTLTRVEIPDSVTSIGEYAFSACQNLTSLVMKNTKPSTITVGTGAFTYNNSYLSSRCVLTVPYGCTEAYESWAPYFKEVKEDKSKYDTNGDSNVSIADVTTLVNVILGKPIQ